MKTAMSKSISLAYPKLTISETFRSSKDGRDPDAAYHASEEIPPQPAKKLCLNVVRNNIARSAAQIRAG
jgi:hypothetical protein